MGIFKNVSESGNLLGKLYQIQEVKHQMLGYQDQILDYQNQISELQQIIHNNNWNANNLFRKLKTGFKKIFG